MAEQAFTPGPWKADVVNFRIRAEGGHIATIWQPREVSDSRLDGETWLQMRERTDPDRAALIKETQANARLIAAAPDLVEALKACEAAMAPIVGRFSMDAPFRKALADARAAIAKAEGK